MGPEGLLGAGRGVGPPGDGVPRGGPPGGTRGGGGAWSSGGGFLPSRGSIGGSMSPA